MNTISNSDDTIDIRDVIGRIEELEGDHDDDEELAELTGLMEQCKGNGGDEQWRGDWYPVTLIRESYFEEAMNDMVAECYELPKDLPFWMTVTYDYEALKQDYTEVDFDGVTYLVR